MYAWTHLPLWVRAGSALIMLSVSTSMAIRGIIWPWGWVIGLFMLFFSFVKPIGPSPWKRYDAAKLPELPPVPRFDGSKLKESPQEVLAKILAARGDKSRPAPDPYRDHSLGKPSGMLWLIGGMAATIFVVLALIGAFR